jgi:hypothetical protein
MFKRVIPELILVTHKTALGKAKKEPHNNVKAALCGSGTTK